MSIWRLRDGSVDKARLAGLVGVGAWQSTRWADGAEDVPALWIPAGVLCAWLLMRPRSTWQVACLVALAADAAGQVLAGTRPMLAVLLAACHLAEALCIAVFMRRAIPDVRVTRHWGHVGRVATLGTLAGCAISGLLALAIYRALYGAATLETFLAWYGAHVLGMVIVGTTAWVVHVKGIGTLVPPGRRVGFVLGMVLLVGGVGLAFRLRYPVLFLTYLPLLMVAFRYRFGGAAVGVSLFAFIAVASTAAGHDPWVEVADPVWRTALLQLYLAGGCLITIPVVLAMAERDRLTARVRESEQRYRLLADYSGDLVVRLNASGERTYVSPSARDMLGWTPQEMLGTRWDLLHPDDREAQRQAMREVVASGLPQTHRYRVRHKSGHFVWTEVVMRSAPPDATGGAVLILSGRDISKRVAAERALEVSRADLQRLTMIDALTGIANRRQLEQQLARTIAGLGTERHVVALFFLDIDHFKGVNDTHGHATGDGVIRAFAQRLQRQVDVAGLVVRLGGDEFVVLLEGDIGMASVTGIARKVLAAVRAPICIGERMLTVTTSIGIAFAPAPASQDDLLSAADEALYKAKQKGRDRYEVVVIAATEGDARRSKAEHGYGHEGGGTGSGVRWE
ncbi:hypothetical protein ASD77_17430 [Pseudoxanthomonas sp. Root65]|nr:hypothetical protein ASD77_17430 [Pseudoxanthomonas sp. Root65]